MKTAMHHSPHIGQVVGIGFLSSKPRSEAARPIGRGLNMLDCKGEGEGEEEERIDFVFVFVFFLFLFQCVRVAGNGWAQESSQHSVESGVDLLVPCREREVI
ncbi:hypothetical protein V6N13_108374 [Hibiscus sabdariffa]